MIVFPSEDLLRIGFEIEEVLLQSESARTGSHKFEDLSSDGNHTTWRNPAVIKNVIIEIIFYIYILLTHRTNLASNVVQNPLQNQ